MEHLSSSGAARQRGFTIVEAIVSLLVTVTVLLGVLALFDFSNKLARVQTNVADMQQSLRVAQADAVRLIRMAGRGGLPMGSLPNGWAVAVRNNVPDDATATVGGAGTPGIVPGSDVLTVRGVFASSVYQVNSAAPGAFELTGLPGPPSGGTLLIANTTPTGIPQDLTAIRDAITRNGGRPEALLLVSARDAGQWVVVELNPGASDGGDSNLVKVGFTVTGGTHAAAYSNFSSAGAGNFPPTPFVAAYVGILEEYRFYVRQEPADPGDGEGPQVPDLAPKLSRARVYPGTEAPWGGDVDNWKLDIADNVFDLQVSLGLDTAAGGCTINASPATCGLTEAADGENDDWMFNGEAVTDPLLFASSNLLYIRLNTLARTDRRDNQYQSPTLVRVEDHQFSGSAFNERTERMYRRRILRTVVDLRNLG